MKCFMNTLILLFQAQYAHIYFCLFVSIDNYFQISYYFNEIIKNLLNIFKTSDEVIWQTKYYSDFKTEE